MTEVVDEGLKDPVDLATIESQDPGLDNKPGESLAELQDRLAKSDEAKRQLTARAQKAESEKKALEVKLRQASEKSGSTTSLPIDDFIDISAALEGLDQVEKTYLAEQHRYTGKPMAEIRKSENFLFWQSAYRAKVEKERLALKPTNTQGSSDAPMNYEARLQNAKTIAEKEAILKEAGLLKEPKPQADRRNIGGMR